MRPKDASLHSGFTLLEMSVVITIIAMMLGGIVVGRNMVRASEVNTTVSKVVEYKIATLKFRDIYLALPGDMPNATDIWGQISASGLCVGPSIGNLSTPQTNGTLTCNGDGNGEIGDQGGNFAEMYRYWKHLENAGLIKEGGFTGTYGPDGIYDFVPGINAPKSPLNGGTYAIRFYGKVDSGSTYFYGIYNHTMIVGGDGNNVPRFPLFTGEEALGIDIKADDGKPNTGRIVSQAQTDCTTTSSSSGDWDASEYSLEHGGDASCALFFRLGF